MSYWKKIGFLASFSIPFLILSGFYVPEQPITFLSAPYAYLVIPVIDYLLGKDRNNVFKENFEELVNERYFDILVYAHVYIQYFLLGWGLYVLSSYDLSNHQIIGLIVGQGIYSGTIINVAHELGHRKSKWAQWHARVALVSVWYHHFTIEHNRGHHVRVATPEDPATSRYNETLYHFWWRSITGSFRSAWQIQSCLLQKEGKTVWSFKNPMLIGFLATPTLFTVALLLVNYFSGSIVHGQFQFLFIQALVAILLLEAVNYIEHYGMLRQKLANGRYEKVNPLHSWNANHFFSNLILFNLQRHSDHHAYASRPYQVLRHFDESPQMPFGYPLMIIMSLFPPLWFKVMNQKLEKWKEGAADADFIQSVVRGYA
ncbi:alkane 1-monooxygenase [Jiulongibacter sediminis]|jgi:alkane 1-monooxygenase|uniref:alkane 1-monooxygenase n=1 Tax=Jiulongibacter sediminis TaxID=1605367 RepID=UPI0026E9FC2B|nr:alkane 1-monooxygenase [Jiulongibacter sediminis]